MEKLRRLLYFSAVGHTKWHWDRCPGLHVQLCGLTIGQESMCVCVSRQHTYLGSKIFVPSSSSYDLPLEHLWSSHLFLRHFFLYLKMNSA